MFYVYSLTVPHATAEASPVLATMALAPGEIHRVGVGFKWGAAGLAHVQIFRSEHQVWPTNVGASFAWNDRYYEFDESVSCAGASDHWTIRAWNDDARHDHDVEVAIGILPLEKTLLGKIAASLFGKGRR